MIPASLSWPALVTPSVNLTLTYQDEHMPTALTGLQKQGKLSRQHYFSIIVIFKLLGY